MLASRRRRWHNHAQPCVQKTRGGTASGSLTVTLPTGLKAAKAQPVNLRGEKTGQPIPVTDGKLTFTLPAYAPASFILQEQL
jgi:hypothetical protein